MHVVHGISHLDLPSRSLLCSPPGRGLHSFWNPRTSAAPVRSFPFKPNRIPFNPPFRKALVSFQPSKEALQLHPDERSRLEAPEIANESSKLIDISWPGARSRESSAASSGASSSTSRASCASQRARTCVWNATESWKGQDRVRSTSCASAPRSERLLRRTFRVVVRCVPPPPPHRRSFLPWRRSARACS